MCDKIFKCILNTYNLKYSVTKSISAGGLDPGVIATLVVVSVVGELTVIGVAYIFLKKRKAPV
jgi:hypothetical protein